MADRYCRAARRRVRRRTLPGFQIVSPGDGGHIAFDGLHIPIAAAGTHIFVVQGARGEIAAVPFTELAFMPFLLLSTCSSLPEPPVSVSGQDFAPDEAVHLFLGDVGSRFLGDVRADDTGVLRATAAFTIPTSARARPRGRRGRHERACGPRHAERATYRSGPRCGCPATPA